MGEVFLKLIWMSATAGLLILLLAVARLVCKRLPGRLRVLLWGIVALRLVLPFSIETALVTLPTPQQAVITSWSESYVDEVEVYRKETPEYQAAIDAGREPVYSKEDGYYVVTGQDGLNAPRTVENTVLPMLSMLWLCGAAGMLIYTGISYLVLKRRLSTAVKMQENVYQSEYIRAPFVFGICRVRIYLPYGMDEQHMAYVLAHEQAHIERFDHLLKPLGFLILSLHWFNPLVWLAYHLFCKDIELACDERVIAAYTGAQKADYAKALLGCSIHSSNIGICPLAFGEVGVKERVKSIADYKKPTFWVLLAALLLVVAAGLFFFTGQGRNDLDKQLMGAQYHIKDTLLISQETVPEGEEQIIRNPIAYCITADHHLYQKWEDGEAWEYLGKLQPHALTNEALSAYLRPGMPRVGSITDSYWLSCPDDNFYLAFQTKNGRTYLGYGWEDISERGQDYSDDTYLKQFYELESEFEKGHINVNFFERSLVHAVGDTVSVFHNYENKDIAGYHIVGFMAGKRQHDPTVAVSPYSEYQYTDLGFAVFETTGSGYRYLYHRLYEDALLSTENGVINAPDPIVIEKRDGFDVVFIMNRDIDRVERVYRAEGKKDIKQTETYLAGSISMILWDREDTKGYTEVYQYCYDKDKRLLALDPNPAVSPVLWFDDADLDEPNWGAIRERNLDAFPGVTFRWLVDKVDAVKEDGEIITLYRGNPIYNVYFVDLTGDGYPELVSITQSQHPQHEGQVLEIYDYQNHNGYARSFQDCDYRLYIQNDRLMVDLLYAGSDTVKERYYLAYLDETVQMILVK